MKKLALFQGEEEDGHAYIAVDELLEVWARIRMLQTLINYSYNAGSI
jgi:hypothetical protein